MRDWWDVELAERVLDGLKAAVGAVRAVVG